MNVQELTALLAQLTGQLQEEQNQLHNLQQTLAAALLHQHPATVTNESFSFLHSDLFAPHHMPEQQLQQLQSTVQQAIEAKSESDLLAFIRDVPVRTTQITGSVPAFAAGARVINTIGPIQNIDGRKIFIDLFRTTKAIALYFQGQTAPAILFNARFRTPILRLPNGLNIEVTNQYTVVPTSVWVNAQLLCSTAPADYYCGLRVKSGTIQLTQAPQYINNQLVIPPNDVVTVDLVLEQKIITDADDSSPYGKDARAAAYHLPEKFTFQFTATTKNIQAVAPANSTIYGQAASFTYANNQNTLYNAALSKVAIPLTSDTHQFTVAGCQSPFMQLSGSAAVKNNWWALPAAQLDINHPLEADGNGALIMECGDGIQGQWPGIQNRYLSLNNPFFIAEPGRIAVTDLQSNGAGLFQHFDLWKDAVNSFGTSVEVFFQKNVPYIFNTTAQGNEVLITQVNTDFYIDRPVKVNGEAIAVQSKHSVLMLAAGKLKNTVALYDDNILWDNKLPNDQIPLVDPMALALHNALFTVTPPNGALLFGDSDDAFQHIQQGNLFLTFGLFSYLPTLPDPYTANLGELKRQFERGNNLTNIQKRNSIVWLWLIARMQWQGVAEQPDKVGVSFYFAPLQQNVLVGKKPHPHTLPNPSVTDNIHPLLQPADELNQQSNIAAPVLSPAIGSTSAPEAATRDNKLQTLVQLSTDMFALLDVSSKANQMGVSFSTNGQNYRGFNTFVVNTDVTGNNASVLPIQVQGMDVVTMGRNAKAFALPQIAWEPVYNFTPPDIGQDPPYGWNYYPNDGISTHIGNLSTQPVALSPIPLSKYLVQVYQRKEDNKTYALFNLPFGMLALSVLNNQSSQTIKPDIELIQPIFNNYINGGIQLELTAGNSSNIGEDNLFEGFTIQITNVNDTAGNPTNTSTLGDSVTTIFNNEFYTPDSWDTDNRSAVPVKRIGLSGYGANMFSEWANKEAAFAQTSQAFFNVATGRTGHEVVQVKSVIYPWGIHVVRTITIFRLSNGYVGRVDSGWKAESDGKFDFSYTIQAMHQGNPADKKVKFPMDNPYEIHPGTIHGLFNIRNIREIDTRYDFTNPIYPKKYEYIIVNGIPRLIAPTPDLSQQPQYESLQGLTFDADIQLENVTEGGIGNRVSSKDILGFVQLAPRGEPISKETFAVLLQKQNGSIGGPINCVIKVAGTAQRMKLSRFDVNNSVDNSNNPIFVAASRGSVLLPKDGSWSMVAHSRGSGDVTPLPASLSVPLIRIGKWKKDIVVDPVDMAKNLLRIAHPLDILRNPTDDTVNFGLLQSLPTQKVLFLTPAFSTAQQYLLSKTPPLLADSYRLLNSKGVFPNIGKADGADIGTAIQLLNGGANGAPSMQAFADSGLLDNGQKAFQLLAIQAKEEGQKLLGQGYKLIKDKANDIANEAFKFDLPSFEYPLVNIDNTLKIYIEYKASTNNKELPKKDYAGKFDFDIDSFAGDIAKTWKGRFHNLAMVVDLGSLKRLMTIQGNFNSQKGEATDIGGSKPDDDNAFTLPTPEIKFSNAVQPVIDILEILSELSTGNYADALKKGLKVAMSNSADIWEYKFEATKDIPLVRFPPGLVYNDPEIPLKLEASMSLGVYFNAALKVTTDPKQLLPTAGAFFQFHGSLQVMCVSLAAATIYAVGNVDLKLSADTSPLIALDMKFGFGAQIVVGLPVVGNVSVLYMVGVEIYADSTQKVIVTAFLLFRGHAELLGGLVGVTITIEASGSIEKAGPGSPTNCKAQVTFAIDISIFMVIDIDFSTSWEEQRQIA